MKSGLIKVIAAWRASVSFISQQAMWTSSRCLLAFVTLGDGLPRVDHSFGIKSPT